MKSWQTSRKWWVQSGIHTNIPPTSKWYRWACKLGDSQICKSP